MVDGGSGLIGPRALGTLAPQPISAGFVSVTRPNPRNSGEVVTGPIQKNRSAQIDVLLMEVNFISYSSLKLLKNKRSRIFFRIS